MGATITGDSSVKFGLTGATAPSIGIVESVTMTNTYTTTAEAKDADGLYDQGAVNMRGKYTEVTISGIANSSVSFLKPGDTLSFSKPQSLNGTYITSLYVTSMEVTGSAGEFNKVSISGYGITAGS
jgi:hypothetical protein